MSPYQVLGPTVAPLLARRRLLEQIERHLAKPTPDHLQVVGPSLFGKSVLLSHLASKVAAGGGSFVNAAYVDLRHDRPTTDAAFRVTFATAVKAALTKAGANSASYIDVTDEAQLHELLVFVFDELDSEQKRLLVVLDGFDHALAGAGLTRNLWDQLRALAQKNSLRLVTGSRRPLRELCKTEESRTSDFWEIFYDTPIPVGPFAADDWDDLLTPLGAQRVDNSARKELVNWTGGVPVLAAAVLARLHGGRPDAALSKADVDRVCTEMLAQPPDPLQQLWDDCDVELRGDLASLADGEGILLTELLGTRQRSLSGRGYGTAVGNKMQSSCRLVAEYAKQQGPSVAELKRLFGTSAQYSSNIAGVLELRVGHLAAEGADQQLVRYLKHAVRDLETSPEMTLVAIRSLVQRALQLIWEKELPGTKTLPDAWLNPWQHAGVNARWLADGSKRLPSGDGDQMYVLDLLTGTKRGHTFIDRKATKLTRSTFLLLDALRAIGDFGQHLKDYPECPPAKGLAVGVVATAIECVSGLTRDLA